MKQTILTVSNVIQKVEAAVLAISVLALAVITIIDVVGRTVGRSLTSANDLSQCLMIVICFVGLSYAASQGRHIRMTAFYDQLGRQRRRQAMLGIAIVTSLLLTTFGVYSLIYVRTVYQIGGIFPALRIPYYAVYAFAPLGFFLAAIQYALTAYQNWNSDMAYLSFEHPDQYASLPETDVTGSNSTHDAPDHPNEEPS